VEYLLQVTILKQNYMFQMVNLVYADETPSKRFERHKTANASAERSGELKFLDACSL